MRNLYYTHQPAYKQRLACTPRAATGAANEDTIHLNINPATIDLADSNKLQFRKSVYGQPYGPGHSRPSGQWRLC